MNDPHPSKTEEGFQLWFQKQYGLPPYKKSMTAESIQLLKEAFLGGVCHAVDTIVKSEQNAVPRRFISLYGNY